MRVLARGSERARQDLNLRPLAPEASALSAELRALGAANYLQIRAIVPSGSTGATVSALGSATSLPVPAFSQSSRGPPRARGACPARRRGGPFGEHTAPMSTRRSCDQPAHHVRWRLADREQAAREGAAQRVRRERRRDQLALGLRELLARLLDRRRELPACGCRSVREACRPPSRDMRAARSRFAVAAYERSSSPSTGRMLTILTAAAFARPLRWASPCAEWAALLIRSHSPDRRPLHRAAPAPMEVAGRRHPSGS